MFFAIPRERRLVVPCRLWRSRVWWFRLGWIPLAKLRDCVVGYAAASVNLVAFAGVPSLKYAAPHRHFLLIAIHLSFLLPAWRA
jgi:hypothetical protein